MQDWTELPSPPSPTGINKFPLEESDVILFRKHLPNSALICSEHQHFPGLIESHLRALFPYYIRYYLYHDMTLTVLGRWKQIARGTASQDSSYTHTIAVTVGTTTTDSVNVTFATTLGVECAPVKIEERLSTTVGRSVAFNSSATITNTFMLAPKSEGYVSAVWWQKLVTYRIEGTFAHKIRPGFHLFSELEFECSTSPFASEIIDRKNEFVETKFSANSKS
jgi:hypothetical protein